jgi:hypothetical protein
MANRREPHPLIPHLYRELGPLTSGEAIYPYLPKAQSGLPEPPPKGLSDAERHEVSPLGGVAKQGGR